MLDDKQLRKRVLLRLLGSPMTVIPSLGSTVVTAGWMFGWNPGMSWFAGLAGWLAAAGGFVTRLLLSGERIARDAAIELTQEEQVFKQQALDELDRRLTVSDKDPRPETALRDLRALVKAFEETAKGVAGHNLSSVFEIQSMVSALFDQCVHSLEQTEKLWQTAQQLGTTLARQPILDQREKLIGDVQASIKQVSDTLVALQRLGAGERSSAELSRIRGELDQSLAVAKRVEERLNSLINESDLADRAQPAHSNQQDKGQKL